MTANFKCTPRRRIQLAALLASAATAAATAAYAQASDTEATVGEVIVTAQKRSERLQDVPVAVSVVSGDQLADRQINDAASLAKAIPSLSFQQGTNPTGTSFRIRGVGTSLFGQGVEPSVSVVLDGVVLARQAQNFVDLADIERIEVLRGPQGTLFGKNSTAGVISVVTARPARSFEARGSATWAEDEEYRVGATVSGPITEAIGVRLTGYYNDVGGHTRNATLGKDVNGGETWGLRGKIEMQPTEALNLLGMIDYRHGDNPCCRTVLIRSDNASLNQLIRPAVAGFDNKVVLDNAWTGNRNSQETYSLQGDLDLGGATLTSITAYQAYRLRDNVDVDGVDTTAPLFTGPSSAAFDVNGGTVGLKQFTQELRIASPTDRRFSYILGLYYANLDVDRTFQRRVAQCPATGANVGLAVGAPCKAPTFQSGFHSSHLANENYAAFGQAELKLTEPLKVIAGLRVQRETLSIFGVRTTGVLVPGDNPLFAAVTGKRSTDDNAVTGRLGLQYNFSRNAQAYLNYSRGYKGQGFDTEITANFATQNPVKPETVDAYEVGYKGMLFDGRMSVAAAAFYSDYSNLQIQANRSDPSVNAFTFVQTNAGSSKTKGFEVEATIYPATGFSVVTGLTYVDSELNADGLSCPLQNQAGVPILSGPPPANTCFRAQTVINGVTALSGTQQNVRGGVLPASPKWRFNLSPRFEHRLDSLDLVAFSQVDVVYQSRQFFSVEQDPLLTQPGYTIVDWSLGVRQPDSGMSVTLFVKNQFDKRYFTTVGHNSLLTTATLTPTNLVAYRPKSADRYVGVTLGFRY